MSKSWAGELELEFTRKNLATQLTHSYAVAPLKIQRSLYPEGKEICHCVLLHTAGGLVGGDRLSTKIHLQPNTQALLTTAAASKIYRSNGEESIQSTHIRIEEGASLEWFPQETIAFAEAQHRQTTRIELHHQQLALYGKLSDLDAPLEVKSLSVEIGDRIQKYGETKCHYG